MQDERDPFYLLAESSPNAIFVAVDGRYAYLNPAAVTLFGAESREQLRGEPVLERIHPKDRAAVIERARQVYSRAGTAPTLEETYLRLDGSEVEVEVSAVPFHHNGENGALVFVRDITERKRTELQLRQNQQLLQSIVDNSGTVIFVKDLDGRYLLANRRYGELFHVSPEAMAGRTDYDMFDQATADVLRQADRKALVARKPIQVIEEVPQDDGVHTYMSVKYPLLDAQGKPYATCGIATDITERRLAEAEVVKLNSELEQRVRERTADVMAVNERLLAEIEEREKIEEAIRASEARYRSLFDNMHEGFALCRMYFTDGLPRDFRYLAVNDAFERLTGLKDAAGRLVSELIPGIRDSNPELFDIYGRVAAGGDPELFETYIEPLDRWFAVSVYSPGPDEFVAVFDNITQRKKSEAEANLAASVFHNTMEGVLITNARGTILSVNPAFTEITGYSSEEAVGRKPSLLRSDRQGPGFYRAMWQALLGEGRWQGEIWNRRKSGEAFLEWLTINRIQDASGNTVNYVSVFHDMTEMRRKDEHIRHLAFHDALTSLPNRALLMDRMQHAIARAQRERLRLSVTFIDLDRFKAINDALGHDVGDQLLQRVARRIQGRMRAMDTVARMGGDEFVVLMEDLAETRHCAALADEIIEDIARPIELSGHTIQIGASMGMAFFPEDGTDAVELMRHADTAMYAAKSAGRNTYRFFRPEMLEQTRDRLDLEIALRHAIGNRQLELHYQPKVDLASGRPHGVEALIRWRHPIRGLVPPSDFIPVAEETNLIVDIGNWVLEEACRQAADWRSRGIGGFKIAVNVSAKQVEQGDLVERIVDLTATYGIDPEELEIELTESVVMANPEHVVGLFTRLRTIGVTVAIDDFGTGYSSLAYLRRLPIDTLKIDRSFVTDMERDEDDVMIVNTILALAKALRLTVVAEGVEKESEAALLRQQGCDVAQGYYYARPLPPAELEAWLQAG